jgi:hypothetical protein
VSGGERLNARSRKYGSPLLSANFARDRRQIGCLSSCGQALAQAACALPRAFNDPHAVIHDDRSLFWVRPLQVDADGAPNAYHRDDPHGRRGLAIEYIGNGMTIYRNGEPMTFELDEKNNTAWLDLPKDRRQSLAGAAGYSVDIYGVARDERGTVCVGKVAG